MQSISERVRFRYVLMAAIGLISLIILALGLQALIGQPGFEKKFIAERGTATLDSLWWMLIVIGSAGLLATAFFRHHKPLRSCVIFFTLLWAGYSFIAYPVLDGANSSRDIMLKAREIAGPDVTIGLVDWKEQNLLQARGPTTDFGFLQPATNQLGLAADWIKSDPVKRRILLQTNKKTQCVDYKSPDVVPLGNANRRSWFLVGEESIAGCASTR